MDKKEDSSLIKTKDKNRYKMLFFIYLVLSIVLLLILALVLRSSFSGNDRLNKMVNETTFKYNQCLNSIENTQNTADGNNVTKNCIEDWEKNVVDIKEYNGRTYSLHYVVPLTVFSPPVFALAEGKTTKTVLLVIGIISESTDFVSDSVFDFAQGKMYVINNQNRAVDVYEIVGDYKILPLKSVPLPDYDIGFLYGITCSEEICLAKTAFHFESGCNTELDVSNDTFGVPVCVHPGPGGVEFTPNKN